VTYVIRRCSMNPRSLALLKVSPRHFRVQGVVDGLHDPGDIAHELTDRLELLGLVGAVRSLDLGGLGFRV
jgi:hypothetical protein